MRGRRSVWSDPGVQALVTNNFVPAADEVWRLQNEPGPESEVFMRSANVGHYANLPNTRQGIYVFAPNGLFLASINSNEADEVEAMLRRGLAKWAKVPAGERYLAKDPAPMASRLARPEKEYPVGGLVLRVVSRDLPEAKPAADWRGKAWNQDFAWFRKEEARAFLPQSPAKGAKTNVPRPLVERLARFHLVDNVRGQTSAYGEGTIQKAVLVAEVEAVDAGKVSLRLSGETKVVEGTRGVEVRLLGSGEYDTAAQRFLKFEMVALGTRWGRTQFNFRQDEEAPSPIGFLLTQAGDTPAEHVAPAFHYEYGWR
ncbi:MAG: hypothetical protein HYZ53_15890 [Planctomycetes bacterium]|nr:hypothetical protein [Planctomycetota bacterium]